MHHGTYWGGEMSHCVMNDDAVKKTEMMHFMVE